MIGSLDPRFKIPAKFRSKFRFRPRFREFGLRSRRNHFYKIRCFPTNLLYVTLRIGRFARPPPLRSVPRPIREAFAIPFWASQLSERSFSKTFKLRNFKLRLKLKKKCRNPSEVSVEVPTPLRFRSCNKSEFLRNFEPSICALKPITWRASATTVCA